MMESIRRTFIVASLLLGVSTVHGAGLQKKVAKKTSVQAEKCPPAPKPGAKAVACVVMPQDKVDVALAIKDGRVVDYKGKRYAVCCAGCIPKFKSNPSKYAAKGTPIGNTPSPAKKKA
ncbi:MAG: hypothetical protein C4320_08720 [Armatimonadota bacterium]